jgi:hypothetical protein
MDIKKEIGKIEIHYKDNPEFKKLQSEMLLFAEEFLAKEKENIYWQGLSLEEQAIQIAFVVFDLLKEGKSKEDVLVELLRFRSIKYAPEMVDRLEEMHRKGLF